MPSFKATFMLSCPVCGRSMRVPVQLLGRTAACGHCHGTFVVCENGDGENTPLNKEALSNQLNPLLANDDGDLEHLIITRRA